MKKNFLTDLQEGKKAEAIIMNELIKDGFLVADVRDIKDYQIRSIDYVAIRRQEVYTIEIKDDKNIHATNNILLEMSGENKPGWFKKCHATHLFIVSRQSQTIYSAKLEDLQQYVKDHEHTLRHTIIKDKNEDGTWEAFDCVLIPTAKFEQFYSLKKIKYEGN